MFIKVNVLRWSPDSMSNYRDWPGNSEARVSILSINRYFVVDNKTRISFKDATQYIITNPIEEIDALVDGS